MISVEYQNGSPVAVLIDGERIEPEGWPPGYWEQIVKNAERYLKYMEVKNVYKNS